MESSEIKARSFITSVALFGAGTVVGASATWLIMSAVGGDRGGGGGTLSQLTTSTVGAPEDGSVRTPTTSRQRCTDQLRRILADLEVRLMDTVDELVARFSMSDRNGDHTSKSPRKTSPSDVKSFISQYVTITITSSVPAYKMDGSA